MLAMDLVGGVNVDPCGLSGGGFGVMGVSGCRRGKGGLRRAHRKAVGDLALGIDTSAPCKKRASGLSLGGVGVPTADPTQQSHICRFGTTAASKTFPGTTALAPRNHAFGTSEVNGWILLGARDDMNDVQQLKHLGVTHVLSIRSEHEEISCQAPAMRLSFSCSQVVVNDSCDAQIDEHFDASFNFMNQALEANGKVLVQCQKGISRSATLVIAYLMQHHKWSFEKTFELVKEKRSIINPNLGFVLTLEKYGRVNNFGTNSSSIETTIVCGTPSSEPLHQPQHLPVSHLASPITTCVSIPDEISDRLSISCSSEPPRQEAPTHSLQPSGS